MKKLLLLTALALVASYLPAQAVTVTRYKIFGGSDVDSLEQSSLWFPVQGAQEVHIRLWSNHLVGGSNADTTFSDSLQNFRVAFSDSVSNRVTNFAGLTVMSAMDSVVWDPCAAPVGADTVWTGTMARQLPVGKPLRTQENGSGLVLRLFVGSGNSTAVGTLQAPTMFFSKRYMRIKVTPWRRNTLTGQVSTQGKRVNGLRGLSGEAIIYKMTP